MEKVVRIAISNRHVHLTEETYNKLFSTPLENEKDLYQPGQFVSNARVTLEANGFVIENVKVLGPFRSYDQVEISHKDALSFKLNPPVRESGDLQGAENITIKGPNGSVTLPVCIIANRHIHMSQHEADELGIKDKQVLKLKIGGIKPGVIDIFAKVTEGALEEVHLDTDDANAFILNLTDEGTLII